MPRAKISPENPLQSDGLGGLRDVAGTLDCGVDQVMKYIDDNQLDAVRVGRDVKVPWPSVRSLLGRLPKYKRGQAA